MGRAINDRKDIEKLQREMRELQGVVAELSQTLLQTTQVHHVDLHDELNHHEEKIRKGNIVIEPDEEFTPPAGKRKKTTSKVKATATT